MAAFKGPTRLIGQTAARVGGTKADAASSSLLNMISSLFEGELVRFILSRQIGLESFQLSIELRYGSFQLGVYPVRYTRRWNGRACPSSPP